jgi:hypothetical protein
MRRVRVWSGVLAGALVAGVTVAVALPSDAAGTLTATYSRVQEWPGSYFQGQYVIANGTAAAVTSWTLTFTLPAGDQLANWWGANVTQSGTNFTATPLSASSIPAGGSATMGFLVTEGGGLADPANCKLNGGSCTGSSPSPTATASPSTSPTGTVTKPAAPTGVTATAVSSSAIGVSWIAPAGTVTGYRVYEGSTVVATSSTPGATVSGLAAGSTHTYAVTAYNSAGESAKSATATATTSTSTGAAWHPSYLAIGTVYTPYSSVDAYFTTMKSHGKVPNYGYRYLIGGDFGGWSNTASTLVSHARSLGMTPVLVEYGMNGNVDGADVAYNNMQSGGWLTTYFQALKAAAQSAATASAGTPVGWVIEPDMLGYIQQGHGSQYGNDASKVPAATAAAHSSGVLGSADPTFANTLKGLVEAINYTIKKYNPSAFLGWQVNEWAVRNPLHDTDSMGVTAGRQSVVNVGNQVGAFVRSADIGYKADLVAFDQWGQDYGYLRDPNPAANIRYLNATHWNNYLLYVKTVRQNVALPAVLWQIAVGHLNSTKTASPTYWNSSGRFPDLDNVTTGQYEDSASTFFFGDSFTSSGNNLAFYGSNPGADPKVSVSGGTVTWGSHIPDAASAGVVAILFGAGTGTGDEGVPEVPGITSTGTTDFNYWTTRTQQYLASPAPLP